MSEKSLFFDSIGGDRKYNSSDFTDYFSKVLTDGVFPNPSTNLQVVANGNMTVTVKPGGANIKGYLYNLTENKVITVQPATVTRKDSIVVRWDIGQRKITVEYKIGETEPTRNVSIYELVIAEINVNINVSSISQSNILDTRQITAKCGLVNSLIKADVSELFIGFEDGFNSWFNATKNNSEENINNFENSFNTWFNLIKSDSETEINKFTESFNFWFENIKGQLDGDIGANLANQIEDINSQIASIEYQVPVIIGTQIQIKKNKSNRLYFKLNENLQGNLTISIDDGATEKPLIDINGVQITNLEKGFIEVVKDEDFFTLVLKGGVSKTEQISGLTATVGFSDEGKIQIDWINPKDNKYKGLVIRYKENDYPSSPTDGELFYDSNDAPPISTLSKMEFIDGKTYYFRGFAYTYKNATRLYTDTLEGATCIATPFQVKGQQFFTSSGVFTVPEGVKNVDVFLVGGGGSGASSYYYSSSICYGGGGGGGGYTKTVKGIPVTSGEQIAVVVGGGGTAQETQKRDGLNGGASSFGTYSVEGGNGGYTYFASYSKANGGAGGSGGGGGYVNNATGTRPHGGSDGSGGNTPSGSSSSGGDGGSGQGSTTKAFEEVEGTQYSGGGGGGQYEKAYVGNGGDGGGGNGGCYLLTATQGTNGTGGGGGGGASNAVSSSSVYHYSRAGGSGIVIVRWGY